ncbi:MAG: FtsX-like permease family protein [Dorea sp.]|nr:FtsX-like permease family protein [Dorea sp.]
MNKIRNQGVINRIADRTRKAGKSRNIIAVLAIALTTVLFTTLFTVGGSIVGKQQESTMRQVGGSAHAGFKYLTQKEYDIVKKDKKLKEVSYRIVVAEAVNKELLKLRTEVSFYEDLDAKFSFCYPEIGHMPEKEDEIVTSDLVLERLGIPQKIGEKVTLELKINEGEPVRKTFTLCGYFKGDTISQVQVVAVSEEYAHKAAPTPETSAMEINVDASDYAGRIMADFNFRSSFNLEKQAAELVKRCGFPENIDTGLNWAYMGGEIDLTTMALIAVIVFVIIASGYLIIYNIFYINVYRDIQYYGLLKTIGTTGKQLRKVVYRQAYMLSLYGIPVGLILGTVIGKLVLPIVMDELVFAGTIDTEVELNVWIFAGAAVFSFITVLLSCIRPCRIASKVSPIEAVRFTEGADEAQEKTKLRGKTKNRIKKTKRVSPRAMAYQNIRRNRKKIVIVVASLSLSLVLLNSVYSLIQGFDIDKFVANMTVSDFSVADATLDNLSVDYDSIVLDGVTEEFLEALKGQKGVEEVGNIYMKLTNPAFTEEAYALIEERIIRNPEVREEYEAMMGAAEGMPDIEEYCKGAGIDGKVYGIGKMIMEILENPEGDLDWEKFSTGKYVIATRYGMSQASGIKYFEPGEKVTVSNDAGETREYEVLAVADMPHACGFQHFGMFNCDYILPEEEYLDLMGGQQPMRTIFNVDKEYEENVEKWMDDYCENVNEELTYTSKASIVEQFDSQKDMYALVGGLLAFILATIGILNFVNTMVTSVLSRKQEFAMMEAVGMTGGQLKAMLCFEGGYYALYTAVCAVTLSVVLSVTAVRSLGENFFFFTWKLTVTPMLLCIPAVAAVVLLVPVICYRSMNKVSVVERMRRAE